MGVYLSKRPCEGFAAASLDLVHPAIRSEEGDSQPSDPLSAVPKGCAKALGESDESARERLALDDGLRKGPLEDERCERCEGRNGLALDPGNLVDPACDLLAETADDGLSRLFEQKTHAFQAEPVECRNALAWKTEGRDIEGGERVHPLPGRHHATGAVVGNTPGCARPIGNCGAD